MAQTPNHGYNVPEEGEENWHVPLNENFQQYDTDIEIRDGDSALGDYEPTDGAKFLATDTGRTYLGDGTAWEATLASARYTEPEESTDAGSLMFGNLANTISPGVVGGTIAGGGQEGDRNYIDADYSTISGGRGNEASGKGATVAGGRGNLASHESAVIGGGINNEASWTEATVGGGAENVASNVSATVGGGSDNVASGNTAVVAGGYFNTANEVIATVAGGQDNTASGTAAAIGGGWKNTASGEHATIPGGLESKASGDYSFAFGRVAEAIHDGAIVFGDSSEDGIVSEGADEARFQMPIYTTEVNETSARAAKTGFEPVDPKTVLDKVAALDVSTWEFKSSTGERHMGPTAAEFHETFDLGSDDGTIATVDRDGVAFAAIQGLHAELQDRDERLQALEEENKRLRERVESIEQSVERLEQIDQ